MPAATSPALPSRTARARSRTHPSAAGAPSAKKHHAAPHKYSSTWMTSTTTAGLATQKRKKADEAARYLTNKAPYLDYPTALAAGWPVATGVIEGACRHLVKDRMDITGARWSVAGAEAVLKLRAVRCNGDFDAYWRWHLAQERRRVHQSRYADGVIPMAA